MSMGFIRTQYLHNYKLKNNSDIIQKITYKKQLHTGSQNRLCHYYHYFQFYSLQLFHWVMFIVSQQPPVA